MGQVRLKTIVLLQTREPPRARHVFKTFITNVITSIILNEYRHLTHSWWLSSLIHKRKYGSQPNFP